MTEREKCTHTLCQCLARENDAFCSDRCKDAHDQGFTEIACDCGHDGCNMKPGGAGF